MVLGSVATINHKHKALVHEAQRRGAKDMARTQPQLVAFPIEILIWPSTGLIDCFIADPRLCRGSFPHIDSIEGFRFSFTGASIAQPHTKRKIV